MNQQHGSYIDLKNCTIFLEDGFSATGAVNNASGYTIGATSVVVDGFTGILPVGNNVTFQGDATEYTITSTVETTGNTTTINITPALTTALTDNQVVTVGPNRLEIKVGDGTLTYSETKNREYKLNRGKLDKVRNGDEAPLEVSLTLAWTYIKSATGEPPSPEECLKNSGNASTWVSTGQGCDPFAVNLVIKNAPTACVGETNPVETITFPEFRYEKLDHDAKAGTIATSGKCNALVPTIVRSAA